MNVVVIDIETTGLNPECDLILEIGAVGFDPYSREMIAHKSWLIRHERIYGDPFALAMNAEILKELKDPVNNIDIFSPGSWAENFAAWLKAYRLGQDKKDGCVSVICAGKNFGAFDLQFLKQMPNVARHVSFKHRSLDPAILYIHADDKEPPNLSECLSRAGIEPGVKHRALDDAMQVALLIQKFFGKDFYEYCSDSKRR